METVPWITHSMLCDGFINETRLHCHLEGGSVDRFHNFRLPYDHQRGWPHPMIDLWSRVKASDATTREYLGYRMAIAARVACYGERPPNESGYDGQHAIDDYIDDYGEDW